MTTQREQFEAWIKADSTLPLDRNVFGYTDMHTALMWHSWQAAQAAQTEPTHDAPPRLLELADRIDHMGLCRRAGLERDGWTQEQKDRCDAGVHLRRYADLLGSNKWRIFPPRPGISFRAGTLDAVVAMAQRDEARRVEG